jgi:hypothetical protein
VKPALNVIFTIVLVVKEASILGGFSQIGGRSFCSHFLVVLREGHMEA